MGDPARLHGLGDSHFVVNEVEDDLHNGVDDRTAARTAYDEERPTVLCNDRGRHAREHALFQTDPVG